MIASKIVDRRRFSTKLERYGGATLHMNKIYIVVQVTIAAVSILHGHCYDFVQ
jgi:hypothetical protein